LKLGFKRVEMLCGPEDFKLNGVKASHNAA
jgi:hypothetical protein